MTLTKANIANRIHTDLGLTKRKSLEVFESLLEIIKSTLESGENVMLTNFGSFCLNPDSANHFRVDQ